jgi:hypothetical protein
MTCSERMTCRLWISIDILTFGIIELVNLFNCAEPRRTGRNDDACRRQPTIESASSKPLRGLAHHRERHDVFADFLDMAVCAIRKRTLPAGPAADAIEDQYMAVVKRNAPEDVRKIPELLGITALAIQEGGCDFLGQVVGDLELLTGHMEPITKRGQGRCRPLQTRIRVLSGYLDQLIPRRYPRVQGTTRQRPCPRFVMGSI